MTDEDQQPESTNGDEPLGLGRSLRLAVKAFHSTIEGIRELVDIVSPHLTEAGGFLETATKGMTRGQWRAVVLWMFWTMDLDPPDDTFRSGGQSGNGLDDEGEDDPPTSDSATDDDDEVVKPLEEVNRDDAPFTEEESAEWLRLIDALRAGTLDEDELGSVIEREFEDSEPQFVAFVEQFDREIVSPDKRMLLNESLLVTAVSAFEILLARIFSIQLRRFPALLDASDRRFSLSDLEAFGTIDDARDAAIQDRVDGLMRQSLEDWEEWFRKKSNIEFRDHCIDRDALHEVIQRRHVVVHAGRLVSKQYREKVGEEAPPIGEPLFVDADYLDRALDELEVAGVTLGIITAIAWHAEDAEASIDEMYELSYELLKNGRFETVKAMTRSACNTGVADSRLDLIFRVNGWIAEKELNGTDSIRDEVMAWDVSALSQEFALAKCALLDDLDAAFKMIPVLVAGEDMARSNVEEWPLLRSLRDDPRYPELLSQLPLEAEDVDSDASDADSEESAA